MAFTLFLTSVLALFRPPAAGRDFAADGNLICGGTGCFCDTFFRSFCGNNFFRGCGAADARLFTLDSSILHHHYRYFAFGGLVARVFKRLKLRDDVTPDTHALLSWHSADSIWQHVGVGLVRSSNIMILRRDRYKSRYRY